MECQFCRYSGGKHAEACPTRRSGDHQIWEAGYNDGRAGKEAQSQDPTYKLGWVQGDSACDASANGCQSWEG